MLAETLTSSTDNTNVFEVVSPPDDSVSALKFSPPSLPSNYLIAGSWDNSVRCWEVEQSGKTIPKSMKTLGGPVLDASWSDNGTKVFVACSDKQVQMWDLYSDQLIQVAAHDAPVKTCHWIKSPTYSCLMTGSWDKTLKFWDTRSSNPMLCLNLPERCYCSDVDYPRAVVGTANCFVVLYSLENTPTELKRQESSLKYQQRAVRIFQDKNKVPTGYVLGTTEGRVGIQYFNPDSTNASFSFKCHRTKNASNCMDIYAVNDIAIHPVHGTLATVGSDGNFNFWDKNTRNKLKASETLDQPITKCSINADGQIFAYAIGYDWSMGHEYFNSAKKPKIFLRSCYQEMKPPFS